MSRLRTVLFDLDGTLVDSRRVAVEGARRGLPQVFRSRDLEPVIPSEETILGLVGTPVPEYFERLLPPELSHLADEAWRVVGRCESELVRQGFSTLYPGARETLEWLLERGILLGIVTNCGANYCRANLETLGLEPLVHRVFCLADAPGGSKADLVAMALRELRGPAAMVGDRAWDVAAGRAHRLLTIGCTWGHGRPAELEEAHHRVDSFPELRALLAERIQGAGGT